MVLSGIASCTVCFIECLCRSRRSFMTMEPEAPGFDDEDGGVQEVAEEAQGALRQTKERVKEKARETAEDVKQRARRKTDEIKADADQKADRWTTSLGEQIGRVGRALRAAGDKLEDEGEGRMSAISASAAETVERMAGYLRDERPTEMVRDLEGMARRNPAAFVATTFAAGLLVGRFFRAGQPAESASPRTGQERPQDPYEEAEYSTSRTREPPYGRTRSEAPEDWEGDR
jgi:hypothetical protein